LKRTRYETLADIEYAVRLFERHERLFGRSSRALKFFTTVLALASVAAILEKLPKDVGVLVSAITAALALIDLIWDPATTSCKHEHRRRDYQRLKADASNHDEKKLLQRLEELRVDDPAVLDLLRQPAYNDVQKSLGHAIGRELHFNEQIFAALS
jgi:uncharacterized membrane protein